MRFREAAPERNHYYEKHVYTLILYISCFTAIHTLLGTLVPCIGVHVLDCEGRFGPAK